MSTREELVQELEVARVAWTTAVYADAAAYNATALRAYKTYAANASYEVAHAALVKFDKENT